MSDINLSVVLTGVGIAVFFILFRFYFVPWWNIFYEKKGTGILIIKMASKFDWLIHRVILKFNGKEFLIFKEDE